VGDREKDAKGRGFINDKALFAAPYEMNTIKNLVDSFPGRCKVRADLRQHGLNEPWSLAKAARQAIGTSGVAQ
jgi:hypothetical protein